MAKKLEVNSKPLIYSIDDDLSMNLLMEARFDQFGCEIKTFVDAKELLRTIKEKNPRLLLVDLNIGEGLSGFDIIEAVRGEMKLDFPIIVLSSENNTAVVAHALELGATDFVVKPAFRFQFEEKISEYIRSSRLPEYDSPDLREVKQEAQPTKVSFQLSLLEVNPLGFTLLSNHLIKKGASFWLSGEVIKKIIAGKKNLMVTVLGSSAHIFEGQRQYQIRVEVDTSATEVIQGIKSFLATSKIQLQN